jgi:hypothetical protein
VIGNALKLVVVVVAVVEAAAAAVVGGTDNIVVGDTYLDSLLHADQEDVVEIMSFDVLQVACHCY